MRVDTNSMSSTGNKVFHCFLPTGFGTLPLTTHQTVARKVNKRANGWIETEKGVAKTHVFERKTQLMHTLVFLMWFLNWGYSDNLICIDCCTYSASCNVFRGFPNRDVILMPLNTTWAQQIWEEQETDIRTEIRKILKKPEKRKRNPNFLHSISA